MTRKDDEVVILVELKKRNDIRTTEDVGLTPNNIIDKSSEAIDKALNTIQQMANRAINSIKAIPNSERPSEVELEFGLKLTSDANALLVNAGAEAHFVVKLKWSRVNVSSNSQAE